MSAETPGTREPDAGAEPPATSEQPAARPSVGRMQFVLPVIVILVLLGGVALLIAGGSTSKQQLPGGAVSAHVGRFEGLLLQPLRPAPPLSSLRNSLGQPVNLAAYRGKAVFVTFLYTHCPDVCPLIASQLHNALGRLGGQASKVQLIAVSVDPRGDKPPSVAKFLSEHQLTGQMQYLIGSGAALAPVWKAWGVGSAKDVGNPEFVNHSALVYGISASGKLTTVYTANFRPSEIVHDVPGLLRS